MSSAPADPAVGRLDPGDAAHRRRPADRAAGVGADRPRREAGRHRRAGAARRPARQVIGVPRVARRRPGQVEARAAERELPGRKLAEQDAARRLQASDQLCVGGRHMILAQFRMAGGRDPGGLDDVLQRVGDTVQRPAPGAGHQLALGRCRLAQCDLLGQPQKAVQLAVMRGDPLQERPGDLDRRHVAAAIAAVEFGNRHKGDIHRRHPQLGDAFNRTRRAPATLASGGEEIDRRRGSASNIAKRAGTAGQTGGDPP